MSDIRTTTQRIAAAYWKELRSSWRISFGYAAGVGIGLALRHAPREYVESLAWYAGGLLVGTAILTAVWRGR